MFRILACVGNIKNGTADTQVAFTCQKVMPSAVCNSCTSRKRKNWTEDRQVALTCEKVMFCAVWNKISSMQKGVYTVEIWIPRDAKRCENIRERDSRWTKYSNPAAHTLLNPRTPKSQCFSAHVRKSDVGGLISVVHWG